jgi:uncharacterized protein with GYD domain
MPKYLIQGSYSEQGLKGVLKEGGSKRREAAEQSIKGMGGDWKPTTLPLGATTL